MISLIALVACLGCLVFIEFQIAELHNAYLALSKLWREHAELHRIEAENTASTSMIMAQHARDIHAVADAVNANTKELNRWNATASRKN